MRIATEAASAVLAAFASTLTTSSMALPAAQAGDLDTTLYAIRLKHDHPAVAYWISWHDFPWSETESACLSLASNLRADELLNHRYVTTAAELPIRRPSAHAK